MDDPSSSGLGNFHRVPQDVSYNSSNDGDSDSFESLPPPPPVVDFGQYKVNQLLQPPMRNVCINIFIN